MKPFREPLAEPFHEGLPNYPSPFTLYPRTTAHVCLWLPVVETLIMNIITQRARDMMNP